MKKELVEFIKSLSKNDSKTLSQKALKTTEELGELAKYILPYENAAGTTHRFINRSQIFEEVADTMLCLISIANDLGFSQEELEDELYRKAIVWGELQSREQKVKYPIPYEIHITVNNEESKIEEFKTACKILKVKPILLDLEKDNSIVMKDLMTSSTFMGDNTSAYNEMKRISDGLKSADFEVVREKIETVPWHPGALNKDKNSYFECHFNIILENSKVNELRDILAGMEEEFGWKIHLSKNIFKKISNDCVQIMATHRDYECSSEQFKKNVDLIKDILTNNNYNFEKIIIEYAIFDSKISHDNKWVDSK